MFFESMIRNDSLLFCDFIESVLLAKCCGDRKEMHFLNETFSLLEIGVSFHESNLKWNIDIVASVVF